MQFTDTFGQSKKVSLNFRVSLNPKVSLNKENMKTKRTCVDLYFKYFRNALPCTNLSKLLQRGPRKIIRITYLYFF